MSTYGRNFEFRVAPKSVNRSGRYYLAGTDDVAIGAPVIVDDPATENDLGLVPVVLATGATNKPIPGQGGILVYEYGPAAFAGDDPWLTTYSDKDVAPAGSAVQVVNGDYVKVVLRNTEDDRRVAVHSGTHEVGMADRCRRTTNPGKSNPSHD